MGRGLLDAPPGALVRLGHLRIAAVDVEVDAEVTAEQRRALVRLLTRAIDRAEATVA